MDDEATTGVREAQRAGARERPRLGVRPQTVSVFMPRFTASEGARGMVLPTSPSARKLLNTLRGNLMDHRFRRPIAPEDPVIFTEADVRSRFQLVELGKPLQAFIAARGGNKVSSFVPGQRVHERAGLVVQKLPWNALWNCDAWPFRVWEIVVDPLDVANAATGEFGFVATDFTVVRELPMEEVIHPCFPELERILGALRVAPWLAPLAPPDMGAVEALLREFCAFCADLAPTSRRPSLHVVSQWSEARELDVVASTQEESLMAKLIKDASDRDVAPITGSDRYLVATKALRRTLLRQSYVRLWKAGWDASSTFCLRSVMKEVRPGDAKGSTLSATGRNAQPSGT